jgi:hypothetical protein
MNESLWVGAWWEGRSSGEVELVLDIYGDGVRYR